LQTDIEHDIALGDESIGHIRLDRGARAWTAVDAAGSPLGSFPDALTAGQAVVHEHVERLNRVGIQSSTEEKDHDRHDI